MVVYVWLTTYTSFADKNGT